jgi:hypothetical protein
VINQDTGDETEKLRGNVVLGRKARPQEYEDRVTVDGVDVDDYERVPGALYDRQVSSNHLLVAENPAWFEESRLDSGTEQVPTGQMDIDIWDLNSLNGTDVEGYDPKTGHPLYNVGGHPIEVRPLNHYLGIAGPDDKSLGVENNIESLAENLDGRGFETDTVSEASWDDVDSRLERLDHATEEESSTFIMYTGHGDYSGNMSLEDRNVDPGEFIDRVDDLDGEKVMVIDQCFAGTFADYEVPLDMTIYMASGPDAKTQGNSRIAGEKRTRYAGRVVEAIESEHGKVDMDDVHDKVASVSQVAINNPAKKGRGAGLSSIK